MQKMQFKPILQEHSAISKPSPGYVQSRTIDTASSQGSSRVLSQKSKNTQPLIHPICIQSRMYLNNSNHPLPPPLRNDTLKTSFMKKIEDYVGELRCSLNRYRQLEEDDLKFKHFIFHMFHRTEEVFLSFIVCQPVRAIQTLIQQNIQVNNKKILIPFHQHLNISVSAADKTLIYALKSENQKLRAEVQMHRKDCIEAISKINSVFDMIGKISAKNDVMIDQRRKCTDLANDYTRQAQTILELISNKEQKQKKITALQREISQILIKLKFKTIQTPLLLDHTTIK